MVRSFIQLVFIVISARTGTTVQVRSVTLTPAHLAVPEKYAHLL